MGTSTAVGTLSGTTLTSSMSCGDLDFDASGSLWVSGDNSAGTSKLWEFNPSTLQLIGSVSTPDEYKGLIFDASGETLYGYQSETGEYGGIDTTTGDFSAVLATDSALFGDTGDLAQANETVALATPEPAALGIIGIGLFLASWRGAGRWKTAGRANASAPASVLGRHPLSPATPLTSVDDYTG